MSEAWIIDAARTFGVGAGKGALWEVHPKSYSPVLKPLAERNHINTDEIDDVIVSCACSFKSKVPHWTHGGTGRRVLHQGTGMTLDRFCGGGTSVN